MENKHIFDAEKKARGTNKAIKALLEITGRGVIKKVDTQTENV